MRRLLILLVCGLFALAQLSGCQGLGRDKSRVDPTPPKSGVEVIIEGGGEFPEFLVGRWKANEHGWKFVFQPDGTISSAVHTLGKVKLRPGQKTIRRMKKGGEAIYEPGEWMVHYNPANRELTVAISLSNFYTELGDDVLEGKSDDLFVGKINEEGNIWETNWTSFYDYTAHTLEYPQVRMHPEHGESRTLVFEKVTKK